MLEKHEIFTSYNLVHIIVIVFTLIVCALVFVFRNKLKIDKFQKILFIVGIITEVIKVFSYTIINEDRLGGYLPKTDLPFHLCSIQIILFAILVFSKNDKIKRVIYGFMLPTCLIGGFAAILIPTYSSKTYPLIFIQYFTYHIAIVAFAFNLLISKEIKFTIKDYFTTLKLLAVVALFALYLNSILYDGTHSVNFMYVIDPPADNLPILNKDHGWFVYFLSYCAVAIVALTLVYIKPIIDAIISKFKKEEIEETENNETV